MNKNDECDIIKDLAVPYVENLLNNKSKIFVEEHLKNCDNCKKYYRDISSNILNETQNEKRKEKCELDFLKKIRKNMNTLKIILILILIIIITIMLSIFIKYQKVTQIVNASYDKIEYLRTLDNYKLTKKTIDINYEENVTFEITSNYYYKNGKYKIVFGDTTFYCEDDSYNKVYVYDDLKQIDYYTQNFIEYKKGKAFNTFSEIISYKTDLIGLYKLMLSKRTDKFNGIDCYVIRNGNDNSYREVWIDKDTYIVLKTIEKRYSKYYRETIYNLVENEVTDEDVDSSVLETELYREYTKMDVIYDATKEIKNIYNNIYNTES